MLANVDQCEEKALTEGRGELELMTFEMSDDDVSDDLLLVEWDADLLKEL